MAKARAIVKRRKAVMNIRKITRTMYLISTVRYQKSFRRVTAFRPFAVELRRIASELVQSLPELSHPLLQKHHDSVVPRVALIVLTSNRGLCGAYNSTILRRAHHFINEQERAGKQVDLYVVGRRGIQFFAREKRQVAEMYELKVGELVPPYELVKQFAQRMMNQYVRQEIDGLHVAITRFIKPGRQSTLVVQLLPVQIPAATDEPPREAPTPPSPFKGVFDFSPDPKTMLDEVPSETVSVSLFQGLIEAAASEHYTRMVSMKSATDNADHIVKSLSTQYNRARQSQITTELSEIIGSAEALKKK